MTQEQIYATLAERSKDGKAWVAAIAPFARSSDDITYYSFASPSRVPDHHIESGTVGYKPMIGWKGKVHGFTNAAMIREQNRGIGCE